VTPEMRRTPLSPPPTRRRSTNSFRAPDFSDMDISRSPSPSPVPIPVHPFISGLQSPIVLDHSPSPVASQHNSPRQSLPTLSAFASTLPDDPYEWETPPSPLSYEDVPLVGHNEPEEPDVLAIPPREPRPYEYIMNPSILGTFTADEPRLPSPPVTAEAQFEFASTNTTGNQGFFSPLIHDCDSVPLSALHVAGSPSCSASAPDSTPGEQILEQLAATILVPGTTSVPMVASDIESLSSGLDEASSGSAASASNGAGNSLPSEVPATNLELPGLYVPEHGKSANESAVDNAPPLAAGNAGPVNEFASAPTESCAIDQSFLEPPGASHVSSSHPDERLSGMTKHLQDLSTVLGELRAEHLAGNTQAREKWSTVDELVEELRKDAKQHLQEDMQINHSEASGASRKRKRDDLDDDFSTNGSVEVDRHITNNSHAMGNHTDLLMQATDSRPTKRRRSIAPSPATLAFFAGGAALWIALGVDYGV